MSSNIFGIFRNNKNYDSYTGIKRYHKPVFRIQCDICGEEHLFTEKQMDAHIRQYDDNYKNIIYNYNNLPSADYICNKCLNRIISFNITFSKRYNFESNSIKNAEDYDYD